jgi:broad specificity phosphatase PhoE
MTDNNMTDNNIHDEMYRQKYLKYKAKYLELRDQEGGLTLFGKKIFGKDKNKDDEIRFKNCAILKLRIRQSKVTLDLVYSGEVKDKKRKYYITPENYPNIIKNKQEKTTEMKEIEEEMKIIEEEMKEIEEKLNRTKTTTNYVICSHNTRIRCFINQFFPKKNDLNVNDNIGKEVIFFTRKCKDDKIHELLGEQSNYNKDIYIVRHGEAEHNVASFLTKKPGQLLGKFDKLLTTDGIEQAKAANNKFKDLMLGKNLSYVFSSKLRRTRQTLVQLLKDITIDKNPAKKAGTIIVLPCTHELRKFDEKKRENCDEYNQGKFVPNENRSRCICDDMDDYTCKDTEKKLEQPVCKEEKCDNNRYDINWNFFYNFYNQPKNTREQCRKNNMIGLLLEFLKNPLQGKLIATKQTTKSITKPTSPF